MVLVLFWLCDKTLSWPEGSSEPFLLFLANPFLTVQSLVKATLQSPPETWPHFPFPFFPLPHTVPSTWKALPASPRLSWGYPFFRPGDRLSWCPSFLASRLGISFAYYGVILASAELLERDLVCGSRSESEVAVTVGVLEESQSPCYCHMFTPSDYRTMIISTIGEIARKCLSLLGGSVLGGGQATQNLTEKSGLSYTWLLPGRTRWVPKSCWHVSSVDAVGREDKSGDMKL